MKEKIAMKNNSWCFHLYCGVVEERIHEQRNASGLEKYQNVDVVYFTSCTGENAVLFEEEAGYSRILENGNLGVRILFPFPSYCGQDRGT